MLHFHIISLRVIINILIHQLLAIPIHLIKTLKKMNWKLIDNKNQNLLDVDPKKIAKQILIMKEKIKP